MDQASRRAAGATRDVAFIEQQNFQPAHRGVASNPGAVDAGADDDDVKLRSNRHQRY